MHICLLSFQMTAPKYPVVFKIGHAHSGYGKVRVETNQDFQVSCFQYHPHFRTLKIYINTAGYAIQIYYGKI